MKATLYDKSGKSKSELTLPKIFDSAIRQDIAQKFFEVEKQALAQPYAPDTQAGRRQSDTGTISHKRHDWKGHYGKGISRSPRKTMWRRGTQFYWVGAGHPGARGGRKAHPPKGIGREKRINHREAIIAMNSAIAATADQDSILARYASLKKIQTPFVIESLPEKVKDLILTLKQIFPDSFNIVEKQKQVRAGKGKTRGRKYKSNAGLLIVISPEEKAPTKQFDTIPIDEISITDLYPLGRLTLYTKKAIQFMLEDKKDSKENKK